MIVGLRTTSSGTATMSAIRSTQATVLATVPQTEVVVRHTYGSVAGLAARVTAAGLAALSNHPEVAWIAPDLPGGGALESSVPLVRANRVHGRFVTGEDVVVAIVDSGIEADHPDFADALIHEECFCNGNCDDGGGIFCRPDCCPDGSGRASGPGSAAPGHPHGTHVAGIVMSRGRVAGVGVAPDTKLVSIRVLDNANAGVVSDWLAALDWIAVQRPDVRVVNMSLASNRVFRRDCAAECETDCNEASGCDVETVCGINRMLADVVARLRRRGTLVVAASGNNSRSTAMSTPACVGDVVAVGATDESDRVGYFSNGGAQLDLLAPGIDIVSSGLEGGLSIFCSDIGGQRVCGGTSMAAPHVSGAAALLVAASPTSSAQQLEDALVGSGVRVVDSRSGRTYPRLDAAAAFHEITRFREIDPGGGSGASDCLLGWSFSPADMVRRGRRPVAACRDGDLSCDADLEPGVCTFLFSLCFNVSDPLLPFCAQDEEIVAVDLRVPAAEAPQGSVERFNADSLRSVLPPFPLDGSDLCTQLIPMIVPRGEVVPINLRTRTASRNDSDTFFLRCEGP